MTASYRFLGLAFVCLDLALEFVNEVLQTFLVLPVFVHLEGEFFEAAVGLAGVLLGLSMAALLAVQLRLELLDLQDRISRLSANVYTYTLSSSLCAQN